MREALEIDQALREEIPCDGPWEVDTYRRQYIHSREYWNRKGPAMLKRMDITIQNGDIDVPCRIHYPSRANQSDIGQAALVFLHGGGWVVGNLDTHDRMMRELAHRSGHVVVGVDYRLSPETRFPDSHGDAISVLRHVLTEGERYGIDPTRVSVGGDSAGAHMSLYCALKQKGSKLPALRAMVFIYGAFGLTDSVSRRLQGGEEEGLSDNAMSFYINSLLGEGVDSQTCGYDLLRYDLSDLPPCLITACVLDPLRDDSFGLATLLERCGAIHELHEYDGVLHGYAHMTEHVTAAAHTLQRCADWLKRYSAK
ncbi:MAG: alpha/beta hydrolase fold domain-containing protein [Gammaproteobacteria bacterium]|nr:alpha/beta hydrolase fold domain-containing protein [Gammaproteobacteria bacterium]